MPSAMLGYAMRHEVCVSNIGRGLRKVYVVMDDDFMRLARNTNNNNRKRSLILGERYGRKLVLSMSRIDNYLSVFLRLDGKVNKGKPIYVGILEYDKVVRQGFTIDNETAVEIRKFARTNDILILINKGKEVVINGRHYLTEIENKKHSGIPYISWYEH